MKFSLIFFSGDERNKYRLVLEAARFADARGLHAVWTPERHFHRFGGLYPNPSVLGAALASVTRTIRIRAGSVIFPAHHWIRIAEEWSVVDNLSGGRVGVALATGFSPIDFAFMPERWSKRRELTWDGVAALRSFWSGAPAFVKDGAGNNVEVELHPVPVQPELPIWLTCTKSAETFQKAGELDCNVLTALIDMTADELRDKLAIYHRALDRHGGDRADRTVTVMLHTFIGDDLDRVRELVRAPFMQYLRKFFTVIDTQTRALSPGASLGDVSAGDRDALIQFGFEKYFHGGSLMGTPDTCAAVVERMRGMGVDEIACLIDFGVDDDLVLASLEHIVTLHRRFHP